MLMQLIMQTLFHTVMVEALGMEPRMFQHLGMVLLEVGIDLKEQHGLWIAILEIFS